MDGRWRSVGGDGDEDLLQIPVPAGCQNGVSSSESRFLMVAAQRKSIWEKNAVPRSYVVRGYMYARGEVERGPGAPSRRGGAARAEPRHHCVTAPRAPSPSGLLAPWVFW
jgi:hypothetical protein